jgi:hypothetical protein
VCSVELETNCKFGRASKEAVVAYLKVLPRHLTGGTQDNEESP